MSMPSLHWLDWPAPASVKACYTVRTGGSSIAPFNSFNLGDHVGDRPDHVLQNRQQLTRLIQQDNITWLKQVHGTRVIALSESCASYEADACFTQRRSQVCCVMTADCLPVFLCDLQGQQVAVAHAGWRGLLDGVLQQAVEQFHDDSSLMAYLGPAISQSAFEVGEEVRSAFLANNTEFAQYFVPAVEEAKWMADLYGIARSVLTDAGVGAIYGGTDCTYSDAENFFSYRRDGRTGRMANLIWLE